MYKILFIPLLLLLFSCKNELKHNYTSKLYGTWVNQDYILTIADTPGKERNLLNRRVYNRMMVSVHFKRNDTPFISNSMITYSRQYNVNKDDVSIYNFKISSVSDSFLYLLPISKDSRGIKLPNDTVPGLKFIRDKYVCNKSIKFDKIIFHSSGCYGNCPAMDVQIDKNHKVLYNGYHTESSLSGKFSGILVDSNYNKFVNLIQSSFFKQLKSEERFPSDAQRTYFIIYCNGQRKTLEFENPPSSIGELVNFCYNIKKMLTLTKKEDNIKMEGDEIYNSEDHKSH